jgi:protein SCO1/2
MSRLLPLVALVVSASVGCGQPEGRDARASALRQPAPTVSFAINFTDYQFGGDFELTRHDGTPFRLSELRGRHALIFFGFTMCPDVCPMTMSRITSALERLGPEAREQLVTLFVTVDVERDTPEVMADYVRGFDVPLIGLTGTRAEVDQVVKQYNASYEITPSDSAGGPAVAHSTYVYLIDTAGKLVYLFRHDDDPDTMAAVIDRSFQICGVKGS